MNMKKLWILPFLLITLLMCGCQQEENGEYTSQLRLNIVHIDESDEQKTIHITYPVFGGISDKEAVTIINTSIKNFVDAQYEEFQSALTTGERDVLTNETDENGYDSYDSDYDYDYDSDTENNYEENSGGDNEDSGDSEGSEENTGDDDVSSADNKATPGAITLKMTFKITYNRNDCLCIVQNYEKNLSEDMKFLGQRSFVFSLANATYLSLGEIFDFDAGFSNLVNSKIKEEIDNGAYVMYDEDSGFKGISQNAHFYFDTVNLYIYYDAMEISPDKDTIPTFIFPLSDVKKYIYEDYRGLFK